MKAVILAGGMGTRMREETEFRPKPMVEIGGRPVLWHIMKNFSNYGVDEFIICLGYKGEVIREYFLRENLVNFQGISSHLPGSQTVLYKSGSKTWKLNLVDTGQETQTGGRISKIKKFVNTGPFFCTYGDGLADVNVSKLLQYHESHRRVATITAVCPTSRFGLLDIKSDGTVTAFAEKPKLHEWINGGYFCFEKDIFEYLDPKLPLESSPLAKLANEDQLMAFKHSGFWQPMDTYREYLELNKMWDDNEAKWKTWQD